jgi:hypothetical protein
MATRVRKTPAVTPTEPPVESAAVVTTRRRATTSRTAATRRVASSSRSQRILVGADLSPIERAPVADADGSSDSAARIANASGEGVRTTGLCCFDFGGRGSASRCEERGGCQRLCAT